VHVQLGPRRQDRLDQVVTHRVLRPEDERDVALAARAGEPRIVAQERAQALNVALLDRLEGLALARHGAAG
jgi:hypothetical protein